MAFDVSHLLHASGVRHRYAPPQLTGAIEGPVLRFWHHRKNGSCDEHKRERSRASNAVVYLIERANFVTASKETVNCHPQGRSMTSLWMPENS